MSCCAGLNTYVPLVVPPVNTDGPLTGVANMTAKKTIYLTGTFNGDYVILGSHDNVDFVPIAKFNGNGNPQSAKRDVDATLNTVRVRRIADAGAVITIGSQLTCACPVGPINFSAEAPSGDAPSGEAPMAKPPAAAAPTSQPIPKLGTKGSPYAAAKPGAKRPVEAAAAPATAAPAAAAPAAAKAKAAKKK